MNTSETLEKLNLTERLKWICSNYENVVFSSSFGQEDQVITHIIAIEKLPIRIFTLDTGRLFQESYELMDKTRSRYNIDFDTYFPNTEKVQDLMTKKGYNSFYDSVENRKECCGIRKIEPLKRALQGTEVWITGLRAEQSENRTQMNIWERDESNNVFKVNPLIDWSYEQMLEYIKENKIPENTLHKKNYVSIGCGPCTRAIADGEHPRAGRWWWETSQKECGLHTSK